MSIRKLAFAGAAAFALAVTSSPAIAVGTDTGIATEPTRDRGDGFDWGLLGLLGLAGLLGLKRRDDRDYDRTTTTR